MSAERLEQYEREWLWHDAHDDVREGYGHHMAQMLYRLPRDGQTDDMKASIESMLRDLRATQVRGVPRPLQCGCGHHINVHGGDVPAPRPYGCDWCTCTLSAEEVVEAFLGGAS